jgi:hypothetical protein
MTIIVRCKDIKKRTNVSNTGIDSLLWDITCKYLQLLQKFENFLRSDLNFVICVFIFVY